MFSILSALVVVVFFIRQCSAENITTTTVEIYGLNSNSNSNPYAYASVYGSIVAANSHALTIQLDCRPNLPTSCTDQGATITAGPSTYAYTSSSSTYYAHQDCSRTALGDSFTCSWKNHIRDSMETDAVSLPSS
jgi:hypothetical protein